MTLTPRDDARRLDFPLLQGWGLKTEHIDRLQGHAADMRRNPTEPEKRLWSHLEINNPRAETAGGAVLDGIALAITSERIHAIMGPGDAGRSTLGGDGRAG